MHSAATGLVAAGLGLVAVVANAQDAGSRPTREFVQAAASSDAFELLEAETALTQSMNADVRAFATRMRQDHQQLSQSLKDAAMKSGLKPPEMAMSADQAQWLGALQSVKGVDFDRLYLTQQSLAHRSAVAVNQIYGQSGDDAGLRQWAASALPVIAEHADMASQMAAKLGNP